jgi:GNAT superfamily N-acetyltransferase
MALVWIHEDNPSWDAGKERILGGAPAGALDLSRLREGTLAPGEWFRVEEEGLIVGYGWMDCTWGDAEVLLAVEAGSQRKGVGAFILDGLEREAASRGLNYLYNAVRPTHPDGERVARWLRDRGFEASGDGLLKRSVRR